MFVILLVLGVLLASTSALVRLGASDQGTAPDVQTARRAYDLLAEGFGAGFNGPIPIVVDVNGDEQAPQRIYDSVRSLPGVASAGEPQFNDEETVAIVFVTPTSAPQDEETSDLVDNLRDDVIPAADRGTGARSRTYPASTQRSPTSPTGSTSACRSSSSTSSASRSSSSRWRSARS